MAKDPETMEVKANPHTGEPGGCKDDLLKKTEFTRSDRDVLIKSISHYIEE